MIGSRGNKILSVVLMVIFVSVVGVTIYQSNVSISSSVSTNAFPIEASSNYTAFINGATVIEYNFTPLQTINGLYIFDYSNITNGTHQYNATSFNSTTYPGNYMHINVINGTTVHLFLYVNNIAFQNMPTFNRSASSLTIVKIIMFTSSGSFAYAGFAIGKV